jgi:hypothetical protein
MSHFRVTFFLTFVTSNLIAQSGLQIRNNTYIACKTQDSINIVRAEELV